MRQEFDAMGEIAVPETAYWGAQTERSLIHFSIREETFPTSFIHAFALQKKAAALANMELGGLDKHLGDTIVCVANEILSGTWDTQFPLSVWQTGSGTQTNMNLNEVISNRSIEILGGVLGSKTPIHPNDHVNMSQSSNDSFPTVMNISTVLETHYHLLPALNTLEASLTEKANAFKDIIKIGRTHLQDATPLTLGQEFSGYASQITYSIHNIQQTLSDLYPLAQGGTAVGTGLNAPKDFGNVFAKIVSNLTGLPFTSAKNKFEALATHDALVAFSGTLNTLATSLMKIMNDIRLLTSGPRSGLGEISLPENEPGSSIMPGKVNPTQCEALAMIAIQVMGNHGIISIAGSQGTLELNTYKPVIIYNILQSIRLLSQGINNFVTYCLKGITPNIDKLTENLNKSLMLVTTLHPHIGYDRASTIAKLAVAKNLTLKEAALQTKYITEKEFDQWVNPKDMIGK